MQCTVCNGNIKFQIIGMHGLGFKIVIVCNKCQSHCIPSYPYIGTTYHINRRFIFTMRVLDLDVKDAQKSC
ncbi:hypothetical protein X777_15256 [Ooceraea biroi]|uniref:Uncharacterized protein n=1 Tax=Ooceraea biroi TaxID=2015173 RepID=A0A026VWG3_OOCBI|nr:hypothetical protein X777_15256 [Ooceraea biroi]